MAGVDCGGGMSGIARKREDATPSLRDIGGGWSTPKAVVRVEPWMPDQVRHDGGGRARLRVPILGAEALLSRFG